MYNYYSVKIANFMPYCCQRKKNNKKTKQKNIGLDTMILFAKAIFGQLKFPMKFTITKSKNFTAF